MDALLFELMTGCHMGQIKTEHSGTKNGGGFWGRRAEAKRMCKKLRRTESKEIVTKVDCNEVNFSGCH